MSDDRPSLFHLDVDAFYCPYCQSMHYEFEVGRWTARYGCSETVESVEEQDNE